MPPSIGKLPASATSQGAVRASKMKSADGQQVEQVPSFRARGTESDAASKRDTVTTRTGSPTRSVPPPSSGRVKRATHALSQLLAHLRGASAPKPVRFSELAEDAFSKLKSLSPGKVRAPVDFEWRLSHEVSRRLKADGRKLSSESVTAKDVFDVLQAIAVEGVLGRLVLGPAAAAAVPSRHVSAEENMAEGPFEIGRSATIFSMENGKPTFVFMADGIVKQAAEESGPGKGNRYHSVVRRVVTIEHFEIVESGNPKDPTKVRLTTEVAGQGLAYARRE